MESAESYNWGMMEGERLERERNRYQRERLDAALELLQRWVVGETGDQIQQDTVKLLGPKRPVVVPVRRTYGSVLRSYSERVSSVW